jgi:hypothetical protein
MIKLINLLKEADVRTLRRVVILALFTSDIPNQMEAAFKKRVSSNPDTDVIKANKKFLEQLLEDKASLMNDPNYQELKKDPDFLRLSRSVTDTLNNLNKAGDLDFGNIAYAKPVLGRNKLSYSTVLYVAAEDQVKNLENYLTREYGEGFVFKLLRTKEMGAKTIYDPTTPAQLDELNLSAIIASKTPVEDLDRELGTNLAKRYTYPAGYPEDYIDKIATSIKVTDSKFNDPTYQEKIDDIYNLLVQMNRSSLGGIKADTSQKKRNVIIGVTHHINPNDIKFFVEQWEKSNTIAGSDTPENRAYFDTITALEQKFDIPINWIPSPNSLYIITQAIDKKFNK